MTRLVPALVLFLAACDLAPKASGTGDTSDTTSSGDTVFAVNEGAIAPGTIVTLDGVVVTSGLTRDGEGFFVADPAGGARSGLYVYGGPALSGDLPFSVGDEVSVTGEVSDFYGWTEFKITGFDAVTVTGTGTVPAPVDLGTGEGVNWEDYESVAVTLADQDVVGIDSYNTATLSSGVLLDDGFQFLDLQCGGSFDSVSGIVFYRYEQHSINPRSDADVAAYTPSAASGDASIADVQAGGTCGDVTLTDVVATSVDFGDEGKSTFFVQDATGAGVVVFVKNSSYDVAIGDVFTLTGSVQEYYDLTEVVIDDVANISKTASGEGTTPVTVDGMPTDWEPYEGQLITISDVEVTSAPNYGQVSTNYAGLFIDDLFTDFTATTGDTFSSVTGVLYYSYEEWKLEPREASDLVR